jgi:hypothetical protein
MRILILTGEEATLLKEILDLNEKTSGVRKYSVKDKLLEIKKKLWEIGFV